MRKVLILGKVHSAGIELLRSQRDIEVEELHDDPDNLLVLVADVHAIIVRMTRIGAHIIAGAPVLQVIARHGVGYEGVDVDALTRRRIPLAIVGDVNSVSVAEHTFALMLASAKRLISYDRATRTGCFSIRDSFSATELIGKTVLIIGFGRIGREVARRCLCFGMDVIVADPFVEQTTVEVQGYRYVRDFHEALPVADYVTIHVPKSSSTIGLLGRAEFLAMKNGATVVNVSRGGILEEAALAEVLASGYLRSAALDVFELEPPASTNPLLGLESAVFSPHSAAFTEECAKRMALACAKNVLGAFAGSLDPSLVVNREVLQGCGRP